MGRHKRLRRMIILVILIICGVFTWNRSGISERHADGAASGEQVVDTLTEDFIEPAKEKYRQYSTSLVEETNAAIGEAVESAVASAAQSFFESMKETVEDFVLQLVPGSSDDNID